MPGSVSPFRQRVPEVGRKCSDQTLECRIEAVGRVESTGLGDVADFHRCGREQVLGVPDAVHCQVFQHSQAACLTE